jgi:hypothetical protein
VSFAGWYVSPLVSRFVSCRHLQQRKNPNQEPSELNSAEQINRNLQKELIMESAKVEDLLTMIKQLKL